MKQEDNRIFKIEQQKISDTHKIVVLEHQKDSLSIVINCLEKVVTRNLLRLVQSTSYNSTAKQCNGSPFITAFGRKVSFKTLAISQNLVSEFCKLGDTVTVILVKEFVVEDIMPEQHHNKIDIWNDSIFESRKFGTHCAILFNNGICLLRR